MTEIPEPEDTGSAGTQQEGITEGVPIAAISPLNGLPIARVVEGLAVTRSRSMGGEVAASLIAGSFTQLSYEYQENKQELKAVRQELESTRKELSVARTRVAVLQERVGSTLKGRHLKNLSVAVGTALIGIGIEFYRNSYGKYAVILGGLGVLLIFFGWFSREGGIEE